MMTCLKKRMVNFVFINQFWFVTKYKIDTRTSASKEVSWFINRVYPAIEVKVSNSLPAFESMSAAHQLVLLSLKSPIRSEENGEVPSIFVNVK